MSLVAWCTQWGVWVQPIMCAAATAMVGSGTQSRCGCARVVASALSCQFVSPIHTSTRVYLYAHAVMPTVRTRRSEVLFNKWKIGLAWRVGIHVHGTDVDAGGSGDGDGGGPCSMRSASKSKCQK